MRQHVETQVRPVKLLFQALNLANEKTRALYIIAPPVVCEDVERILIAALARIVPIAFAVATVILQRFKQIVIDVNLRPYLYIRVLEPSRVNYLSRNKAVAVRLKIR